MSYAQYKVPTEEPLRLSNRPNSNLYIYARIANSIIQFLHEKYEKK